MSFDTWTKFLFSDIIILHPVFSWVILNVDRIVMTAVDALVYERAWIPFVYAT